MRSIFLVLGIIALPVVSAKAVRPVAVDWSGVSDQTIEQCRLRGLEGLLVQALIEEQYAVVDRVDENGISVAVTAGPASFELRVSSQGVVQHDWIDIPRPCDSSISLDIVQRVTAMTRAVDAKTGGAAAASTVETAPPPASKRTIDEQRGPAVSRSPLEIDFQLAFPGHLTPLLGGSLQLHIDLGAAFLTIAPECTVRKQTDLTLFEPALAAGIGKTLGGLRPFAFDIGLEAAGIVHLYSSRFADVSETGGHVDGRIGLPLAVTVGRGRASITAMPYLRFLRLEHFFGESRAYTSERWGILVRVGVGL